MNCQQFAHHLGADPANISADMHEHTAACAPCAQLMQEVIEFDNTIKAALEVDVPAHLGKLDLGEHDLNEQDLKEQDFREHGKSGDNVIAMQKRAESKAPNKRPQWFAMAAAVLLAVGISFGTWYGRITAPLPQSLVAHVQHEPYLLTDQWDVVPVADVEQVLTKGRVSLNGDIGTVRHAGLCSFRGNKVAHVVVHTESGPVTVMLLPDEPLQSTQSFDEDGFKGVLIPVGTGSIAIIGDDSEAMKKVRKNVTGKVAWSI